MKRLAAFETILSVFLVLLAVATLAQATSIVYRTPQEMGEQSSLVVQGKVAGVRSFWNEGRTKILTETLVDVDEAFKGSNPGLVRVVQLGGTVGTVKVTVAGALRWKPGEEVLLFLEAGAAGAYQVSGFSQGKFRIERDPETGEAFVSRPAIEDAEILGAPSDESAISTSREVKVPLAQFINDALNRR
jgi:hypothetical protein